MGHVETRLSLRLETTGIRNGRQGRSHLGRAVEGCTDLGFFLGPMIASSRRSSPSG